MRCTFVAIGAENVSIQALSAMLKLHGHETALAYDQSLFNDYNYLTKPVLARMLDHENNVISQIVSSKPDMVAFSVMTPTYSWAIKMASRIKKHLNVPVIFGGVHATVLPEQVISNSCVDMVCVGEGDHALLELCNSLEHGKRDNSIKNIWFKKDGKIICNEQRPLIEDLDSLPLPDKELFSQHVPIKNYYLAVTSRGCPYACSYCSLNYYAKEADKLGSKRLRERSPDSVIHELKIMRDRYRFGWVDFRNNTFTATRKWVVEFLEKYRKEIGLPFRVFGHPSTIDKDIAFQLKGSGCYSVQLGIESYSERVRKDILHRNETNKQVLAAVNAMDNARLHYSMDYILGLPTQTEEELIEASRFFIQRRSCYRVSPFMLEYLPKLDIVKYGIKYGEITETDVANLEKGEHSHYVSTGSLGKDPKKLRFYLAYRLLFRLIPFLPNRVSAFILKYKIFKVFPYLPVNFLLSTLDVLMVFRRHDKDAYAYAKNYWFWFRCRFKKDHPAYRKKVICQGE